MKIVRQFKPSDVYMGRFEYGSDLITSLEAFCGEHHIRHAWVQVIGALSKAAIGYYEQARHDKSMRDRYAVKQLSGEYEIISCSGNISVKDGKPFGHLHIAVSDTQYQTFSGHLMPGSVELFAGEFVIQSFEKAVPSDPDLDRCPDEVTGLALW